MWQHVRGNLVHRFDRSIVRFAVVGIGNTLVGLWCIYVGKWLLQLGDVPANLLGYACGLSISFVLNQRWSFRYQGRSSPALARLLVVIVIAYLLNLAVVVSSRDRLHLNSYLAQALGIIPYAIFGYMGGRDFACPPVPDTREYAL
ncbi:MAG TPA: GtrA family protein [Candidatus Tectomicrobia bacterium]|jgi:putative flippase GtrA